VHTREVLDQQPWIVFPGNAQGRHARETGAKGATMVTVQDGRITTVEPVVFDSVRWAQVTIPLDAVQDEDAALALIRNRLADALRESGGRLLAARLLLTGAGAALNRDIGTLRERIKAEAVALAGYDELWLESIGLRATPREARAALPGHLAAHFAALTVEDLAPAAGQYVRSLLDKFGGLREDLGLLRHPVAGIADDALPPDLLERARSLLLARLAQE
jgi:hypothetical protein